MSSTHKPHDHPSATDAPHQAARRRAIKLGAGALPVALTLASRPSFAASQCNTTSAWGSAILRAGVASTRARAVAARIDNPTWTLTQLLNDQPGIGKGWPWSAMFDALYPGNTHQGTTRSGYAQAHVKVTDLFGGGISGYSGMPDTAFAYLTANASTSDFTTALLVARINARFGSAGAAQCLASTTSADILAEMATGSFVPSNGGLAWTSNEILQYLRDNNYVVA